MPASTNGSHLKPIKISRHAVHERRWPREPPEDPRAPGHSFGGDRAGLPPSPDHDLVFRGGKTIANLVFTNFYVGGVRNPGHRRTSNRSTRPWRRPCPTPRWTT